MSDGDCLPLEAVASMFMMSLETDVNLHSIKAIACTNEVVEIESVDQNIFIDKVIDTSELENLKKSKINISPGEDMNKEHTIVLALEDAEKKIPDIEEALPTLILKYNYIQGQWSPANQEGIKKYNRNFLLDLKNEPQSQLKPNNLPEVLMVRSKPYLRKPRKIPKLRNMSEAKEKTDVKLKTVENPWKSIKTNETEDLYKNVMGILNKITPEKFDILMTKFMKLPIDTGERLLGVVDLIFIKAVNEPIYSTVYASMCKVCSAIKVVKEVNGKEETLKFKQLIISKCQKNFDNNCETLNSETEEMNKYSDEKKKESDVSCLDKEWRLRKGTIRFIGELFKVGLLTTGIILRCIEQLLLDLKETSLECLSILLTTVGKTIEFGSEGNKVLHGYFDRVAELARKKEGSNLSPRIRFMLQDLMDLRQNEWEPRRKAYIPKTIEEINMEMEAESLELSISHNELAKRGKHKKLTKK